MKKILLSTVLPFVFVAPVWADDVVHVVDTAESAVQQVVEETADGVLKAEAEPAAGHEMYAENAHAAPAETGAPVVAHAPAHGGAHWGYAGVRPRPIGGRWMSLTGCARAVRRNRRSILRSFCRKTYPTYCRPISRRLWKWSITGIRFR